MSGLTSEGFEIPTLEELLAEIEQEQRDQISTRMNTATAAFVGQLNKIYSSKNRELWELGLAIYSSQDPDQAIGAALDAVSAITGTVRRDATKSTVVCTVNVDPGTYAAGALIANVAGSPDSRFVNRAAVVNGGGGAANVTGQVFEAEDTGPVRANNGTLTQISNPVSGWNSITNTADAVVGSNIETDAELRIRREQELRATGAGTLDSIRADLLNLEGVETVTMLENVTDTTNGDGLPPHSFEAIVYDGTPTGTAVASATIAAQVWESKPAGIRSFGSTDVVVVDSSGNNQTVEFTRPSVQNVYLEVDLEVDTTAGWDVGTSPDLVKTALVEWSEENLGVGEDVILSQLYSPIFEVAGVVDVLEIRAGFSASPSGTVNLTITARQIADFDTGRIVVDVP